MSKEEHKITTTTISGVTFKNKDIEPSIIVGGKSYTPSEFNKAVEMLKQPTLNESQQSYLKSAIDEIERSMLGNKDRNVNELYLYNAIRFIKAVLKQEEE